VNFIRIRIRIRKPDEREIGNREIERRLNVSSERRRGVFVVTDGSLSVWSAALTS